MPRIPRYATAPARAMRRAAWLLAVLPLAACQDLFVPNFNDPTLDCTAGEGGTVCALPENPTRAQIGTAVAGVLIATRLDWADYVRDVGILGRENYDLDGSDPRFISEMLRGVLDPGSRAFGGDHWYEQYAAIRSANVLLDALPGATSITDEEKEGVRGFAKTMIALNLLIVANGHDQLVLDEDLPIGELGPLVSREEGLARISELLDEAQGHLQAAGAAFPFRLTSGFAGFDTPATFLEFNRALKARVEVYRGNFAAALQALTESFLTECSAFDRGVYHTYSTAAGDLANDLFQDPATADVRAHPALETFAQTQPGGELDRRFLEKTFETDSRTQQEHSSDLTFTVYDGPESPVPIIRNEELILLRAEANIGLGNVAQAATDLNCIRQNVGGLAPRNDLSGANALDELLYNRTFSLLFEGGHRWVDYRRYGRLGDLPIDVAGDVVHERYPIPRDEQLPRGL